MTFLHTDLQISRRDKNGGQSSVFHVTKIKESPEQITDDEECVLKLVRIY